MSITVYLNYIAKAFSFAKEEKNELTVCIQQCSLCTYRFAVQNCSQGPFQSWTFPAQDRSSPGPFQPRTVLVHDRSSP